MHEEFCKRVDYVIKKYGNKTAITFMRENNTKDKLAFYQIREFINGIEKLLYEAKK